MLCYVMFNEHGHSSLECRHRQTGPVFCHHCQAPGHKTKHHMYYESGKYGRATTEATLKYNDDIDLLKFKKK